MPTHDKVVLRNANKAFIDRKRGRETTALSDVSLSIPESRMVCQQPQLFPWLSIVDNITFAPRMAGQRPEHYSPLAAQYIQLMGLTGFEKHYPYELSGGMQ